jgi:LacI family transcriptional regulator
VAANPARRPPRPVRPTLKDVAREAGVSARTVSRVLHDEPRISPDTRERVLQVVRALGFRPNVMARNMRVGARDAAVGLVIPDLANPFFGTVASGVEGVLRPRHLHLVIASSEEDPAQERSIVGTLLDRQVTALIIVPSTGSDHNYLRAERRRGLPVVFLDRPPAGLAADCVVSENCDGAQRAVGHLLAHGHRRVAFVGDAPAMLYTRRERFRGYRQALDTAGVPFDRTLVDQGHHEDDAAAATRRLLALPDPPTAVFAANNLACMGVVSALAKAKRRDIALVGFDDFTLAEVFEPAVSVVAQDVARLGTVAAELAMARLDGDRSAARTVALPTTLLTRGSGELAPAGTAAGSRRTAASAGRRTTAAGRTPDGRAARTSDGRAARARTR